MVAKPYILAPILLIFGIAVTLVGRRFFAWTIGTLGCAVGFGVTMILFSMFDMLGPRGGVSTSDTSLFMFFLQLVFSLMIGFFVGFIMMRMLKIGAAILGATGGAFLGMALYQLAFFFFPNFILTVVFAVIFGLAGAILSFKYFDGIVILGTAFVGAYSIIRGASLIFGNYPNEIEMFKLLADGNTEAIPYQFLIYMGAFMVLFIASAVYQFKMKRREREHFIKVN